MHRRLQGGQGGHGSPQRPDKNEKKGPIFSILHYQKKKFLGGHAPRPPQFANFRIFGARYRWPPPMRTSGAICDHMHVIWELPHLGHKLKQVVRNYIYIYVSEIRDNDITS